MSEARFVVYVRRYDSRVWLPIGCPDRASADAMINHTIGESGEYDVARLACKIPGLTNVYAEDHDARRTREILADPPIGR